MFGSRICFFLVTVVAVVGLALGLTIPRTKARIERADREERLLRARAATEMLLRHDARRLLDVAASFARVMAPPGQPALRLDATLEAASRQVEVLSKELHETTVATLRAICASVSSQASSPSSMMPEIILALDRQGRAVGGLGLYEEEWGEDLSPYPVLRDALHGYGGDDLWLLNEKLYRVAASPVVDRRTADYVGAVVVGDEVDSALGHELAKRIGTCGDNPDEPDACDTRVAFFAHGRHVVTPAPELSDDILEEFRHKTLETSSEALPFVLTTGSREILVALESLPGEAGAQDAFFAVFTPMPQTPTLMGWLAPALGTLGRTDWILLGSGLLLLLTAGMVLMWLEADRPLKHLALDAVALGKGESDRFAESEADDGKTRSSSSKIGAIRRSVNIALDKLHRDVRAAHNKTKDLGAVLGPAPGDLPSSPGTFTLPSPPAGRPMGSFSPPPPSDFSLEPPAPPAAHERATTAGRRGPRAAPPAFSEFELPAESVTPPPLPRPMTAPAPNPVDDGLSHTMADEHPPTQEEDRPRSDRPHVPRDEQAEYVRIYEEFLDMKRACGERVESLTYEKFTAKLDKNRDQLVAKYGCKAVKFQVYIKDGKAALRATPVK